MNTATFDRYNLWHYRARLVRVIDADTIVCLVDTGFGGRQEASIRLRGIDAPERNTPAGEMAEGALRGLLPEPGEPQNWAAWPLRVVTQQRKTIVGEEQSFARYVADVYVVTEDGSGLMSVADWLVDTGFARPAFDAGDPS